MAGDVLNRGGVVRVRETLQKVGLPGEIVSLENTARSAEEAALALGVEVAQIVKSLVFKLAGTEKLVLVLASGVNRVDEAKLESLLGAAPERPDARTVKKRTGFSIGGVPPVGHAEKLRTLVDRDLFLHDEVWAAAGHTHAVFACSPEELVRLTGSEVADVKTDP